MYNKFNQYLLENYPIYWHTRFVQMLFAGFVSWFFSFIIGFFITNYNTLNTYNVEEFYFSSFYVMFHGVFLLIILVLWALNFFKNNPLKSFYPLQKFYLHKVFLQLFVVFTFLIAAYLPFTYGVYLRGRQLMPQAQMKADALKFNLGYPFLIANVTEYDLSNKSYPRPFPLEKFQFDYSKNSWDDGSFEVQYNDSLHIDNTDNYPHSININNLPEALNKIVNVDGNNYIFYTTETKYKDKDSCYHNVYVKSFVDVSTVYLRQSSLYNFSKKLTDENRSYYDNDEIDDSNTYDDKFLVQLHQILNKKNQSNVINVIEDFKNSAQKYQIDNRLDANRLAVYLIKKDFANLPYTIVSSYQKELKETYSEYSDFNGDYAEAEPVVEAAVDYAADSVSYAKDSYLSIGKNEPEYIFYKQSKMYVDFGQIEQLYRNYDDVHQSFLNFDKLIIFIIIGFFIAAFLLWFEFTYPISFLIAIPIAGVIGIIVGLCIALMNYLGVNDDKYYITFVLIVGFLILGITFIAVFSQNLNKRLANILVNISYPIAILIWAPTFLQINDFSKKYYLSKVKCETPYQVLDDGIMPFVTNPVFWLLTFFVGLLLYLLIIKKWMAKKVSN